VTGVSGSEKSSLVSQALPELVAGHLGRAIAPDPDDELDPLLAGETQPIGGDIVEGITSIRRLVRVDQKPIGGTPRSNLATYTGLFDNVARSSPTRLPRASAATTRPLLVQRREGAAARPARAKASSASNCCSCRW
jgi:excinuclease UvrABC ATPase subunit